MSENAFKGIGINLLNQPQYTDHLATLCCLLEIPLLFGDEEMLQQAQSLYPGLHTEWFGGNTAPFAELVANYEAFFISDIWSQEEYMQLFGRAEQALHKQVRLLHCPHGYSDKDFWLLRAAEEDIALVYGPRLWNQLQALPMERHAAYVRTGNFRYAYYRQHQETLDAHVARDVFSQFARKQLTALYAPTWKDLDNSTSFFEASALLLESLPEEWNLVVKLHPNLEAEALAEVYALLAQHEGRPNVAFVRHYPLVYPILAGCAVYIGDRSAVGYDFLAFDRPLFFLNPEERRDYLAQCGLTIAPQEASSLFDFIAKEKPERLSSIRKKVYREAFGEEIPVAELRASIARAIATPPEVVGWVR